MLQGAVQRRKEQLSERRVVQKSISGRKSVLILTVANVASSGLTFVALGTLSIVFPASQYAAVSVGYAAANILTAVVDARFAASRGMGYRETTRQASVTLLWRVLAAVAAFAGLYLLRNQLHASVGLCFSAALAGSAASLLSALLADVQAARRFVAWSVISVVVNASRCIAMLVGAAISPAWCLAGHATPALVAWLLSRSILGNAADRVPDRADDLPARRTAYITSSVLNGLNARLDVILVGVFSSANVTADWSRVSLLLSGQLLIVGSAMTYGLPHASSKIAALSRRLAVDCAAMVAVTTALVLVFILIVPAYHSVFAMYLICVPGLVVNAFTVPASLPLYRVRNGWPLAIVNAAELGASLLVFIPLAGVSRNYAAYARLANWLVGGMAVPVAKKVVLR